MKEKQIIYYQDEINDDFANSNINAIKIDKNYKYIHKNLIWKFISFFAYRIIATPVSYIYAKIKFGIKVENKKILKYYKNQGYFIYANHTQPILDTLIPTIIGFPKKAYVIAHPDNLSIKYIGKINGMLGALPIPGDITSSKNFMKSIKYFIKKKNIIAVYPEAHVWPYYTKIRNFKSVSFKYPVQLNVPSFAFTTTYHSKNNKPKITVYIDGPFYPKNNQNKKQSQEDLRNEIYTCMNNRSKNSDFEYIKYKKIGEKND